MTGELCSCFRLTTCGHPIVDATNRRREFQQMTRRYRFGVAGVERMVNDRQQTDGAPRYYCRRCSKPLPAGWQGLFHPDCLKTDKRRRVQEQREKERRKFQKWLSRQECPKCGARFGQRQLADRSAHIASSSGSDAVVPEHSAADATYGSESWFRFHWSRPRS